MPPKRAVGDKDAGEIILQLGKYNNVVAWNLDIRESVGISYGNAANFLTTDVRYVPPLPREEDFAVVYPVGEGAAPAVAISAALLADMKKDCFNNRRRRMEKQTEDEAKIWSVMWTRMSSASQSKVREQEGFQEACVLKDCVLLWEFIRRTHLTHIFGEEDPMMRLNKREQESRYTALKQGEREQLTAFKTRFDAQIQALRGAGVADMEDEKLAMDFIYKLDDRRYNRMLTDMRNKAVFGEAGAYPTTLVGALRIASGYVLSDPGPGSRLSDTHAAFVSADSALVTKAKDPEKGKKNAETAKGKKESGKKKSLANLMCFVCGTMGHYARDCPEKKVSEAALLSKSKHTECEEEIDEYDDEEETAYVTTCETALFSRDDVLLDSQASVNVFCNRKLLRNVRDSEKDIILNGVQAGAKGVRISQEGDFSDVGKVYYSENSTANILSYAVMVDQGNDVAYDKASDSFVLKPLGSETTYKFCRKNVTGSGGKFYCCNVGSVGKGNVILDDHAFIETASENMTKFTKREVDGAYKARSLLAKMGFPPIQHAIEIATRGSNFTVTARDFSVAESIWGPDIASLKGKTKKRATNVADTNIDKLLVQQEQILSVDILYVEGVPSLIGLASPLDLTMAVSLFALNSMQGPRSASVIKNGIMGFVSTLASRNFVTRLIMSDGEGAIGKIIEDLNLLGMEVDISGAGGHVSRIERKIQTVKERVRAHISHQLPFALTTLGIAMLVLFCVSRLNYQTSGVGNNCESPRVIFSGRQTNQAIDFRAAFGEYAQCTVANTDSNMGARTEDCIVMLPTGNRTGSVKMMSLATGKLVTRDQFKLLPMPSTVVDKLNDMAAKEGRKTVSRTNMVYSGERGLRNHEETTYIRPTVDSTVNPDITTDGYSGDVPANAGNDYDIENIEEDMRQFAESQYHPQPSVASIRFNIEDLDVGPLEEFYEPVNEANPQPMQSEYRHSDASVPVTPPRSAHRSESRGTRVEVAPSTPLKRDLMNQYGEDDSALFAKEHVMNITVKEALRSRGAEAQRVITKELAQMIDKRVWTPVQMSSLSSTEKRGIIRSQMFLKEKYLPTGAFEKLKARLVAGGNQQDRDLYDDLSSPTVSTSVVMTVFAIAAYEKRKAVVVDIGGAFLNAKMDTGINVHMRLDSTMSKMLSAIDSKYGKYTDDKGCIVVRLDKALYGCVESAALWYENLSQCLNDAGYEKNQYDVCVFNKKVGGLQCTIAIHVDDLIITSTDPKMIEDICAHVKSRYGSITRCDGPTLNYLGMVFDLSIAGEVRMTMKGYIEETIAMAGIPGKARSPATDGLFETREGTELVNECKRSWFHSVVAKLSYLAKRAKPECLTAVSYLATRVTKCTTDDIDKLNRVMKYIAETREMGVVFRPGAMGMCVRVYVDAAYGVHADGKSHTGSCVVIGDVGAVHCKSSKQTIVSKSSTEAELIALSDSANQGLHLRNFLLDQGYDMGPVIIYQDNTSCMALVDRGRSGAERTRHISIRYFWIKERVQTGEAIVIHKGTKEMYANVLTKPLQGAQFLYERNCLTGWNT